MRPLARPALVLQSPTAAGNLSGVSGGFCCSSHPTKGNITCSGTSASQHQACNACNSLENCFVTPTANYCTCRAAACQLAADRCRMRAAAPTRTRFLLLHWSCSYVSELSSWAGFLQTVQQVSCGREQQSAACQALCGCSLW